MKVELEMYIDEDQESIVMEKVLVLTKKAEELGSGLLKPKLKEVRMKNPRSDKKNARKKNQRLMRSSNGGIKLRTMID